jgi:hypothetical protein
MAHKVSRRRSGAAVLAALAIVISGCGGTPASSPPSASVAGPTPAGPTPVQSASPIASHSPTPPPSPSPSPSSAGRVAGEVLLIGSERGYIDTKRANRGDPVFERGFVRTDENGSLQFRLDQKIRQCTLVTSSRVDIKPSDELLLHYASGTAVCETTLDGGVVRLAAGDRVELRMSDPLYVVTVEPEQTRIRVVAGLLEVRSNETGGIVLLGPSLRSDVFPGGGPTTPETWGTGELDDDVREAVDAAENQLPEPDLTMPDPTGSPTLQRILDGGIIRVGLDERLSRASQGFAESFGVEQGVHWNIKSDVSVRASDVGHADLRAGEIDLLVTPDPLGGFGGIPFFDDEEGARMWLVYDELDPVFGEAERTFLRNMVIGGSYRILYFRSFGQEPSYTAVAELFGL